MTPKKLKRIIRSGPVSPEEAARDREIRRKVEEEFPPAPQPAIPDALSDALKQAIRQSDLTAYEIAKRTGVSQIVVSRFVSGERDIRMATADKLAHALGLKLVAR